MRSLRLFRRDSPNGQPLEPAPRCLGRGTRRAFSFAGAERTVVWTAVCFGRFRRKRRRQGDLRGVTRIGSMNCRRP